MLIGSHQGWWTDDNFWLHINSDDVGHFTAEWHSPRLVGADQEAGLVFSFVSNAGQTVLAFFKLIISSHGVHHVLVASVDDECRNGFDHLPITFDIGQFRVGRSDRKTDHIIPLINLNYLS